MSFDGPAQDFVDRWAQGVLRSKLKEGSLSRRVEEGPLGPGGSPLAWIDTLYSYAVPIASAYWLNGMEAVRAGLGSGGRKYLVISNRDALERTSVTTNKHLRWVEHAARFFAFENTAHIDIGRIPTTADQWTEFIAAFEGRAQAPEGLVTAARQNQPGGRAVLHDWMEEHGFPDPQGFHGFGDLAFETAQRMLVRQSREAAISAARDRLGANPEFWIRVLEYLDVLPASTRFNGAMPWKKCSKCGRSISEAEWNTLELVGYFVMPPEGDDPGEVLEMRNDGCRTTLSVLLPFSAVEFQAHVEEEQQRSGADFQEASAIVADRLRSGV